MSSSSSNLQGDYGFYIKGSTESCWTRHWFHSSDGPEESYRPKLVINVEPSVTKYYYAAGARVAMNQDGVVYFLHADHGRW